VGDTFLPDGGQKRHFETLWWQAGRYVQVVVRTQDDALTINRLLIRETRYPLEMESEFHCGDERLTRVTPIAMRTLQMCAHETYMDCPYYEQLMYVGDTRLEALTTYATTHDDRLPRKALKEFDYSRLHSGMTTSRFPSRSQQIIPSFSLWWICMVHDYAHWRDDAGFVRALMPGVRAVIESFLPCLNADGLLRAPRGWNFVDWVPQWPNGMPPDADTGVSGPMNWLLALALARAAELEDIVGEEELAARDRRLAAETAERTAAAFWVPDRKLFADDLAHEHFSEHSQVLAILTGLLPEERTARLHLRGAAAARARGGRLRASGHLVRSPGAGHEDDVGDHGRRAFRLSRLGRASALPLLRHRPGHTARLTGVPHCGRGPAARTAHERLRPDAASAGGDRGGVRAQGGRTGGIRRAADGRGGPAALGAQDTAPGARATGGLPVGRCAYQSFSWPVTFQSPLSSRANVNRHRTATPA